MEDNLIWVDMEFTGLDLDTDRVLEIATIVTDSDLETIAVGPVIALHEEDIVLSKMDEWNQKTHTESGLIDRVRKSSESVESAEKKTLAFLKEHTIEGKSPMCGNSVHVDRIYMRKHMPELEKHFDYRNVDVSSIKELANRWYPKLDEFEKEGTHIALDDIMESIGELKYYRENLFKQP
jgi:oligoribonuclease